MADVVLAELNGQIWLIGGEEHLDDILVNQLSTQVTVELVPCGSSAELHTMWAERSPDTSPGAQPWALNPKITARVLGRLGLSARMLQFSAWSAMLDGAAQEAVSGAAAWLAANPGSRLLLRQFEADAAMPGQADLQRLRMQLVTAALARAGVDPAHIREEMGRAKVVEEAERLEIVTETGPAS